LSHVGISEDPQALAERSLKGLLFPDTPNCGA
jgi:hypothetical protein